MPARRSGPGARSTLRASGCGACGFFARLVACGNIDENAAVLDLDGIGGNAILLEAGFAEPAAAVKFPIVPGADDVFAIEPPVAERPAHMIACVRDRAELSVPEGDRDLAILCGDALERRLGKVRGGADIDPVFICHCDPFH